MAVQKVFLLNQNTPVVIPSGLVPKGAYDNGTDYAVGDSVDYNGSSYVMYADAAAGTVPTDTTKWQVLANKGDTGADSTVPGPAGADGADGASITSAAFDANDIVFTKDDASTVTLTDAAITLKGDTGDTGATGATGATGPAGADGVMASIVAGTGIAVDDTDPANPIVSNTQTSAVWGSITGTLADQTDLASALGGGGGGGWALVENLSAVGATSWTFASTLDLSTDRLYKVEVYLDYENGSGEAGQLHIRPNGTTSDMTYTTTVFDSSTGSMTNSKSESTSYGRSVWVNSTAVQATFYISPMSAGNGAIYRFEAVGVTSPVIRKFTGAGAWKSTTTNMTSLNFYTNTASNAVIGSFKLYKVVLS